MRRKVSEAEFAKLCARYNIWAHKWRDVHYCPNCNKPIFPKRVEQEDTRSDEAQESIIDYLCFILDQPIWVEVKGKHNMTSWPFNDMNEKQRNFLRSWNRRGVAATMFLAFGPGPAPNRGAWWIPYPEFADHCNLLRQTRKSIPYQYAVENFTHYRLEWSDGGWEIPRDTWIRENFTNVLKLPSLYE